MAFHALTQDKTELPGPLLVGVAVAVPAWWGLSHDEQRMSPLTSQGTHMPEIRMHSTF